MLLLFLGRLGVGGGGRFLGADGGLVSGTLFTRRVPASPSKLAPTKSVTDSDSLRPFFLESDGVPAAELLLLLLSAPAALAVAVTVVDLRAISMVLLLKLLLLKAGGRRWGPLPEPSRGGYRYA